MDVFYSQTHFVKPWSPFLRNLFELSIILLNEACECLLVDERNMELHHEPIDQMNEIMA